MMPGMLHMDTQAHLWLEWRILNPTSNVKNILTIPLGMFRSAECLGLKPKLRMSVDEYVVTTPEDTDCCFQVSLSS